MNFNYRRNEELLKRIEAENRDFFDRLYGYADDNMSEIKAANLIELNGLAKVISISKGVSILGIHFGTKENLTIDCKNRRMFHQFSLANTAREKSPFQCIEHRRCIFDTMAASYSKNESVFSRAVHNTSELLNNQYNPTYAIMVAKELLKQQCSYWYLDKQYPSKLSAMMSESLTTLEGLGLVPSGASIERKRNAIDKLTTKQIQEYVFGNKSMDSEDAFKVMRGQNTVSVEAFAAYKFGMDWRGNQEAVAQVKVLTAACGVRVLSNGMTAEDQDIRQFINANAIIDYNYGAIFNSLMECTELDRVRLQGPELANDQKVRISTTLNDVNKSMTSFVRGISESSSARNTGLVPRIAIVDDEASKMMDIVAQEVEFERDAMQSDNLM